MNLELVLEHLKQAGSPLVPAMFAALALLFWVLRPVDRDALRHTAQFYALALAGQIAMALLDGLDLGVAGDVLRELFVIMAGIAVIRLWGLVLFRLLLPALRMHPPRILEDVLVIVGYVAWGMIRLRYAGLDMSQIVTTSAVITAVIAFSMQDTLGNILGGLAIQLDDSLRVGDWIRVDEVSGRVTDIRWRSVSLETNNWETVVIPNAQLMKSKFTVLAQREGRPALARRWIWFDVDYSAPPSKVIAEVLDALQRSTIPHVAADPAPQCLLMALEAGRARYALRYWLDDLARDDATDAGVRLHLLAGLQRAGLAIAAPQYSVHMLKEGEKQQEAGHLHEIERRLQALRRVDIFAHIQPGELRRVAERLVEAPFAPGEVMTRQGAEAHWLDLLVEGEAEVVFEDASGRHPVSKLAAGTVFGERGMMLGERRSATVTALGDTRCYRLDRAAFEDIIRSRPQMAEDISRILAAREMELRTLREALDAEVHAHELKRRHGEILDRIREFFSLN
ncbi:MAG: cyclic nucleotide-binding domain-containing protein [Betaproteobacteria bacterium]